jgi:hypothetical protein
VTPLTPVRARAIHYQARRVDKWHAGAAGPTPPPRIPAPLPDSCFCRLDRLDRAQPLGWSDSSNTRVDAQRDLWRVAKLPGDSTTDTRSWIRSDVNDCRRS